MLRFWMWTESHLRVTKGACSPPLLRSVGLRLSPGCRRTRWAGVLGCHLSAGCEGHCWWFWIYDSTPLRTRTQGVTYHFSLQSARLLQPCPWLRFQLLQITLGSKMIDIFLNWQHQLPFLILIFCFYWAPAWFILCYHLNKHFIKHRINCLFFMN